MQTHFWIRTHPLKMLWSNASLFLCINLQSFLALKIVGGEDVESLLLPFLRLVMKVLNSNTT